MPGRFLFWADCGPEIGMGHVMRCAALAEAGSRNGLLPILATRFPAMPVLDRWRDIGARIVEFEPGDMGGAARLSLDRLAHEEQADAVVVDRYGLGENFWAGSGAIPLVVIDDLGEIDPVARIVVNPNPGAERHLGASYSRAARRLLGPRYALIRPEIIAQQHRGGGGILITLGGGNVREETLRLACEIAAACSETPVRMLAAGISRITIPRNLEILPPGDLAPWLAVADLVVCGGGVTALEAACIGVPMLLSVRAENQRGGAEALEAAGAARLAASEDALARLASELMADGAARRRLGDAGQNTIDGRGATRVMDTILDCIGARSQSGGAA